MVNSLLITTVAWVSIAAIFRCEPPGEPVLYSDRPCEGAHEIQVQTPPQLGSVPTPVSGKRVDTKAAAAPRTRPRRTAATRSTLEDRVRACDAARTGLRGVQLRRRRGYTIAEGARLADEAEEYKEVMRENC
ncbi:MAG: hypothetical protein H6994_16155 [Pseudomonadales bacterium]|nr:hypothetical protein [Pseudomonadales bacterium]